MAPVTLTTMASPTAAAWKLAHEASDHAGVTITEAHDAATCRDVTDIIGAIWGPESEIVNPGLLVALAHAGNLVALASVGGTPIGAAVGFCGPPGRPYHSHVVGLLPNTIGKGMGRALKLYQRAWCLERGITTMTWTYDPLVARNAYFNLRRLSATAVQYYPDFYGDMSDSINAGQFSDRMLTSWDLASTPDEPSTRATPDLSAAHLAVANVDGQPGAYTPPPADSDAAALVAVPRDIEDIRRTDPALARQWRVQTRRAFTDLLERGWVIRDFVRSGHYVLRQEASR